MPRRKPRNEASIWPGFVDGLSTLLLVVIFVLSIFVVAQFYLGEELASKEDELASKDDELSRLTARLETLADELGLAQAERDRLQLSVVTLEENITQKESLIAGLEEEIATGKQSLSETQSTLTASVEALEAEKELSANQKSQIATLNEQMSEFRQQLASLQQALEAAQVKDKAQQVQIKNLSTKLNAALARKVQELAEVRSRFFEALREVLGDRDDVRVVGDRFIFESDILFGSCSDIISVAGRVELEKFAQILLDIQKDIPAGVNWVLRVDGHADKTPLGPGCLVQFQSNWHLSTARSISVVRFLVQQGIPQRRLMAAGFGEFQPLVSSQTMTGLAQNRRIEFKLTER